MSEESSSRSIPFRSKKRLSMDSPCSKPQIGNPNMSSVTLPTPEKPPEKYFTLGNFFDALDSSILLSKLRGSKPIFSNISKIIEHLTKRRFCYSHLAQLKHILPEAIEIKRVLIHDETTCCMKPDLHVILNADAVKYNDKSKSESTKINLRKVFRARLADFVKAHPQGDEVPEEPLPELFNGRQSNVKVKSVSSVREDMASIPVAKLISSPITFTSTPVKSDSTPLVVASTPPELASTPARLFSTSLAACPQKRSSGSTNPDDVPTGPPFKLVRRSLLSNFDSYTEDKKAMDVTDDEAIVQVPEEDVSSNDEILSILPDKIRQSIIEHERNATEDQNPAISLGKRRQKMISCLPKLFNVIHYLSQSRSHWVITKEELVYKITASHSDITDTKEVEEQLILLQELVPEWIYEKRSSSDDLLVCINKLASPQTIQSRLEEQIKQEMAPPLS